jgi:hypothetical protein
MVVHHRGVRQIVVRDDYIWENELLICSSGGTDDWRIEMKTLAIEKLPSCFGIRLAQDLIDSEVLGRYFEDAVQAQTYANQLGVLGQLVANPLVAQTWNRVSKELDTELSRKRGEPFPCKECDVRAGCFLTALLLIGDKSKWIEL